MALKFLQKLGADDIFISYTRLDASTYAMGLADELTKLGFSCFTDRLGTDPNKDLPETLRRKIRSSSMLVVVGTERAGRRDTVEKEIREFLSSGRTSIVPVNFNDAVYAARWYPLVEGIAPEPELNPKALDDGDPSDSVVSRIKKQFNYRRRDERLRRVTRRALSVLALLIVAIVVALVYAGQQVARAKVKNDEANEASDRANKETAKANEATARAEKAARDAAQALEEAQAARDEAERQKVEAKIQKDEADKQRGLAEAAGLRAKQAETRAVDEQARARREHARAERESAIAEARSLANRSQTVLRQRPEDVWGGIGYAVDSMKKSSEINVHAVEADTALRESLALFPRRRASYVYAKGESLSAAGHHKNIAGITAVALSPDGRHFASVSEGKLSVYESGSKTPLKVLDCECSEIALSGGATLAAGVNNKGGITIFDLKAGGARALPDNDDSPRHIALSPGGRYLALTADLGESEGRHTKLTVLEVSGGRVVKTFDNYLATPGDLDEGEERGDPSGAPAADDASGACDDTLNMIINDVAFGPTGILAVGGKYNSPQGVRFIGRVAMWDLGLGAGGGAEERELSGESFGPPQVVHQTEEVASVAPGADTSYFATDKGVWKRLTGRVEFEPVARLPRPLSPSFQSSIRRLAFGGSGSLTLVREVTSGENMRPFYEGLLEVWDATGHRDLARAFPREAAGNLSFGPGGELVAVTSDDPANVKTHVFVTRDGSDADKVTFEAETEERETRATSPGADFVIHADEKGAVVWDVWAKRKTAVTLDGAFEEVSHAAISPGGKFFALAGQEKGVGSVVVYRSEGDSYSRWRSIPQNEARERNDSLTAADFGEMSLSADGRRLAVRYSYGEKFMSVPYQESQHFVRVWDVDGARDVSPNRLRETYDERLPVTTLSPCGRFLVVADGGKQTRLMDLSKGNKAEWQTLLDSTPVTSRAFSTDERYLGLGSEDGVVYVFDTKGSAGAELIARLQHTGRVTAVAFSDGARYVATASSTPNRFDDPESHPLRVWLLRPSDMLAEAEARKDSVSTDDR